MINPFNKLSDVLAAKIAASSPKYQNQDSVEVLRYGIYVLLTDMIKTTILLTTAYFLGLLPHTLFAMAAIGLLRIFVGGVHAKTFWGCLLANSTILLGISFISVHIMKRPSLSFLAACFSAIITAIYLYAPADNENKPVRGKKHRKRLRIISFSIAFTYLIIIYLLKDTVFSVIMSFAFLVNAATMLPIAYTITKNRTGEYYYKNVVIAKES